MKLLANVNLTTGVFSTVLIVVVILSAVFLIVFLKMVARNKASSQSFDHELNDKLTDERKLEKARWSNDLQLEYQAKEKLIEEIQRLSGEELNDYKRFYMYIRTRLEPNEIVGCGDVIQFASEELRANRQLIMEAVQWPNVVVDYPIFSEVNSPLKYASEELRDDREVVLWAIWNCADAYEYASEEIRSDTTAYLSAVRSAARPRTEIDPSHVPKRLYEDSNAFYQMLKSLGSTEELNSVLASYTAPQGYIVPVDDSDELFDYVGDTGMTHLFGFDDQIRSLFSDRDLLIQALNETSWAHYFVPKKFSHDSVVSRLAEDNRLSQID